MKNKKKTFQGSIIFRMLGEDDKKFQQFVEDYAEHCHYSTVTITPQLRKMVAEYKRGINPGRLMREYGVTNHNTFYRIVAVALRDE